MASFTWIGGGIEELEARIVTNIEAAQAQADNVVRESVYEGEKLMKTFIETSTTPTGEERVATNGASSAYGSTSPGRIDSGTMINTVGASVASAGGIAAGKFGWADPEKYFDYQENGTERVEPMHALMRAYIQARESFYGRVRALAQRVWK